MPVYTNPLAESILEYHPAISMVDGRIVVHNRTGNAKLRQLIFASMHWQDNAERFNGVFKIDHAETTGTLVVMVRPHILNLILNLDRIYCIIHNSWSL